MAKSMEAWYAELDALTEKHPSNLCLKRHYGSTRALPAACKVRFWNGRNHRVGFKPNCLRKHGYRMVLR